MKTSIFTSIRAKIFSLMLLGVSGMLILSITNSIFDHKKSLDMQVAGGSQQIESNIIETMMLEEQFISRNTRELLPKITALRQAIDNTLKTIRPLTSNTEIQKNLQQVEKLLEEHGKIFKQVSETISLIAQSRKDFRQTDDRIIAELNLTINKINEKETLKLMEGEFLSEEEKLVGALMKDFISFDSGKTVNLLNLFIFGDTERYLANSQAFEKKLAKMIGDLENILSLAKVEELNQAWNKILALIKKNREQEKKLFDLWQAKQKQLAQLKENSSQIQSAAVKIVKLSQEDIDKSSRNSRLTGLLVAGIGLAAILVVGFMIILATVKPIRNTVDMLKNIAEGEGDLTSRLEIKSRDEISELAYWFNQFISKVQTIIKQVAEQVDQLNHSSTQLSELSQDLSSGSEQVLQKAGNVATAAEEMSSNTNNIAATTEQTTENVNLTATAIQEMTSVINEISGNTARARTITTESVSQANSANQQVNKLGGAASEIGKVIETITSISSQVNLLALNATIEAARAGEAGKGFAVVANEIKELAQQTANAANEIRERIEGIQHSTKDTISEIETITTRVNEVNEIVSSIAAAIEEQSATTREISENIISVSANLNEVNDNIAQSSVVASEIAGEISEVTSATQDLTDNSTQVNLQASELSSLAEQLEMIVKQFKI